MKRRKSFLKGLQPVRKELFYDVLCELENKERVFFIGDGMWITTKALIKRTLNETPQIEVSPDLIGEVIAFLIKHPELGYTDIKDFIKDAILHTIKNQNLKVL